MISVVVSACLLGEPCRYDGKSQPNEAVKALGNIEGIRLIPICPEVQGGLQTPRPAAEIQPGAQPCVINVAGENVTSAFEEGAQRALFDAVKTDAWVAILKAKSPSCGSGLIYDGTFSGTLTEGWGITADLFRNEGITVLDEKAFSQQLMEIHALNREDWNTKVVAWLEGLEKQARERLQEPSVGQVEVLENSQEEEPLEEASEAVDYVPAELPPVTFKKAWGHFKTITKHKVEVAKLCFKIGLYWQGIKHDLSKYSPVEFGMGARFYQGFRSPNAAERECRGFTEAWLHHKGRNKHHFEYWLDLSDDANGRLKPAPMPIKYVLEMMCDRIAACKIYKGAEYTDADPYNYFDRSRGYVIMHPATKTQIESLLRLLAEEGEGAVVARARQMYTDGKRK